MEAPESSTAVTDCGPSTGSLGEKPDLPPRESKSSIVQRNLGSFRGLQRILRDPLTYAYLLGCVELCGVILYARSRFPQFPVLGWDSVTYVSLAYTNAHFGVLAFVQSQQYPWLYVQLLTAASLPVGNPFVVEAILPPILAGLLILIYVRVASHLALKRVAILAVPLSAGVSLAFLRIESDLNRTLLALVLCWCVLDLVAVQGRMIGRRRPEILVIALSILAICTEVETWFVAFLAISIYALVTRSWRLAAENVVLGVAMLGALFLVFPAYFLTYASAASLMPPTQIQWNASLDFGLGGLILAPLAAIGTAHLLRKEKVDKVARRSQLLVLSWVVCCGALFALLPFLMPSLPAIRALLLIPMPLLLGSAIHELWRVDVSSPAAGTRDVPSNSRRRRLRRWSHSPALATVVSVTAIVLLAGGSYYDLTQYPPTNFMQPYISLQDYQQLQSAGRFLNSEGISTILVPVEGSQAMWLWELYQGYLQAKVPNPVVVYGAARYTLSGVNPGLYEPFPANSQLQKSDATQSFDSAQKVLERANARIGQLPLLVLTPDIYNSSGSAAIPNLPDFEVEPGIYYVPAGRLALTWQSTWTFNWTDVVSSSAVTPTTHPGSISAKVLTGFNLSSGASASVSFSFFNLVATNATIEVRIVNYASNFNGSQTPFAPVDVLVDGQVEAEYSYPAVPSENFEWMNVDLPFEPPGVHTLTIASGEVGHPLIVTVDTATLSWG